MLNIYKASAGSGKTFTLAREYIKMLLGLRCDDGSYKLNPNPINSHRNILAITFTNKATDEMKRRIIHELAVLAGAEPGWAKKSNYADLANEFGCTPHQLKEAAVKALRRLLFDFNYFNVSTIDAFFQTILRTFAQEAELTGNYELELQNKQVVEEGVSRVISSLSEDPDSPRTKQTIRVITAEMKSRLKEAKSSKLLDRSNPVYRSLVEALDQMHNEKFAQNEHLADYLKDRSKLNAFRDGLNSHITSLREIAIAAAKGAVTFIESLPVKSINANFTTALRKVADGQPDKESKYFSQEYSDDVAALCNKSYAPDETTVAVFGYAITAVMDYQIHSKTYSAITSNLLALSLMGDVMEKMEEYRTENNAMLLSDTNSLLREIIGDDDAPFVYERMGQWFNNYLIDEFQDTSNLQWQCLSPLVREGLSEGDNSLIIGDEKQCIYRFRNSEPELLGHKVEDELKRFSSTRSSDTNYRSSVEVVEFNNTIFAQMAQNLGQNSVYAAVRQKPNRSNLHGYVKINRMSDSTDKEEYNQESLDLLAADIRRQLNAGYRPADIAVLTRFNNDGREVINYLLKRQVDDPTFPKFGIVSDDALSLASAPVVNIIVGALRARAAGLLNTEGAPSNRSRAGLEQMISRYETGVGFGFSPDEALRAAVKAPEAETSNAGAAYTHSSWSLLSLVEGVIAFSVPESQYGSQHAFIAAFMDVVQEFSARNPSADINSFLAWWSDNGRNCLVSAPADTQAIRVMSIHKSKGLEFPCVHIPLLWEDIVKFKSPEWFDTEGFSVPGTPSELIPPMLLIRPSAALEGSPFEAHYLARVNESILDELNVLYVAFTRAVTELSVHTYKRVTKKESSVITESTVVLDALRGAYGVDLQPGEEFSIGEPTAPGAEEKKEITALEPTETVEMSPFFSNHRPELWEGIVIDTDNDQ